MRQSWPIGSAAPRPVRTPAQSTSAPSISTTGTSRPPETRADALPETLPETLLEALLEALPETLLEALPETLLEALLETLPETLPEALPEASPAPATWLFGIVLALLLPACTQSPDTGAAATSTGSAATFDMRAELERIADEADPLDNPWDNERRLALFTSYPVPQDPVARLQLQGSVAQEFLLSGRAELAVEALRLMIASVEAAPELGPPDYSTTLRQLLGLAYLRLGEEENCIEHHVASACILPFDTDAVHKRTQGADSAIAVFRRLEATGGATPTTRYLMNIAAMALGRHPDALSRDVVLTPEELLGPADHGVIEPFQDIARELGLNALGLSGGGVVEDFDGDGDLDVLVSSWGLLDPIRYFQNDGGTFTERTTQANLSGLSGGLNMQHADYDNDGDFDVLVLRGAWLGSEGHHPNSLLRNEGNGAFVDVTDAAGMLSYHPTQTAAWADFDGDGWLDVFIGNESTAQDPHPSELYVNNRDGSFSEVADRFGIDVEGFVKGATAGDYDNDGDPDLFLSLLGEPNMLFRNDAGTFTDVTTEAGVAEPRNSFPAWFFDYDQDGYLDLLVLPYDGDIDDVAGAVAGNHPPTEPPRLYRNVDGKRFADHTERAGLPIMAKVMGSNFGDLDNDGFPDFYLGTGDPDFRMLVPNRMFRNIDGERFSDVTLSGRFGHLQKGHAVAFADLDDDGDNDVHVVMGGAFSGDVYPNAVFRNPNPGGARSVVVTLRGTDSNRSGVGARLRAVVGDRSVFATVGSGGSFGSNPMRQLVGIGDAARVDTLEVLWPWSNEPQVFTGLAAGFRYVLAEDETDYTQIPLAATP